jgi:translation initiation factor IF-1
VALGKVLAKLARDLYKVRLEDGDEIVAHVARELRNLIVRVKPGDQVAVTRETEDPSHGRISEVYR